MNVICIEHIIYYKSEKSDWKKIQFGKKTKTISRHDVRRIAEV